MKQAVTEQSDIRHRSPAAAHGASRSSTPASVEFIDNRPEAVAQRRLADTIHNSPSMVAQRQQLRSLFGEAAQLKGGPEEEELLQKKVAPVQRREPEDEKLLQGKFEVRQRKGLEEEEPLQGKFEGMSSAQLKEEAPKPNASTELSTGDTGLPDNLKSGIESLSGLSMDNVNVHYNSSQPARLNALAYTQGADIHVAPGQEKYLPHEAWHVVQQAQGRVQPTMQLKDGVPVNDDQGLEHDADVMGATALQSGLGQRKPVSGRRTESQSGPPQRSSSHGSRVPVQRVIVTPEPDRMDTIIAIAIYQMLRNGIDDKVVPADRLSKVDLSKEKQIHVQGHGEAGKYEGKSPATLIKALESAKVGFDNGVSLLLDYCYSAEGFEEFRTVLSGKEVSITGNLGRGITQDTGEHFSKPTKFPTESEEIQQKFKDQCGVILKSTEWSKANELNAKLQKKLASMSDEAIDPTKIAQLFLADVATLYGLIKDEYNKLYPLNEKLKDEKSRESFKTE